MLPAELQQVAPVPDPAVPALDTLPPAQGRVLVVDDNRDAAETLGLALRYSGYDVVTTTLPQEALDRVRATPFDAAVLDIGMPVIDGYELAALIRRELGVDAPRLIALTGYGQASDRAKALSSGFDEHMVKPIDLDQLARTLERLIRIEAR
jgi:CheY-like chemotaxis protein